MIIKPKSMLQIINNVILIFLYNNPIYNALSLYVVCQFVKTPVKHLMQKAKVQEKRIRKKIKTKGFFSFC